MTLSVKHQAFINSYFLHHLNATEAYCDVYGVNREVGRAAATRLLAKVHIQTEIARRTAEKTASADEILIGLTEQGRASLGDFFKVIEEWTFYPLPTQEVLGTKEIEETDDDGEPTGVKRVSYWVRHVALDMDKLVDPRYAHLVKKFGDSPKSGLSIELYDRQSAWRDIAKLRGLIVDKTDVTSGGEPINLNVVYKNAPQVDKDDVIDA
jgi:hypothetical protein